MIGYAEKLVDYFRPGEKRDSVPVPASLFWRKGEKMGIDGLQFELFPLTEKHKMSFKLGDHPLQNGVTVTDHVTAEPRKVTIDCIISNHSLSKDGKGATVKIDGSENGEKSNVALEKFEQVKSLANKREPVRLVCSLEVYPKMVITSIDFDRDEKSGSAIRFSMTLREIRTVDIRSSRSSYVFQPSEMDSDEKRLIASKARSGKRSAEEKDADQLRELLQVEVIQ